MKSILQSIKPQYCELIASGKKTIEVRKTRPKLELPFKVYIYCTKGKLALLRDDKKYNFDYWDFAEFHQSNGMKVLGGKVIGEYVCDAMYFACEIPENIIFDEIVNKSCLSEKEIIQYSNGKELFGWHISDLKIYDKPKELSEFYFSGTKCRYNNDGKCTYKYHCFRAGEKERCGSPITRPPQSWCYVESV